jgi:hypothetical protein
MTKVTLVAIAAVLLVASPAFATGNRGQGGPHQGGPRVRSSLPTRVFPHQQHHGFHGHRFHGHNKFHGHGSGFGVILAPPVIGYSYAPPVYAGPEYVTPAPAYAPPSYAPPAYGYAPPPSERIVEFPNGRYLLQGDGVTAPYRWVWIPSPPPAPPADEPVAPSPPPAPPGPTSRPEPTRTIDFYRWTDEHGVTHFSDRLESVPEAYRSKATKSRT